MLRRLEAYLAQFALIFMELVSYKVPAIRIGGLWTGKEDLNEVKL